MPTRQELFSPANAFIQGQAARQQYDYGQSRNALAQMDVENAPREQAARNKLLDLQTQGAQQQIDATKAKDGYARLAQALASGNPKQYVLQYEPEFVAAAAQHGADIASLDDETAAEVIKGFASQYAGAAGIAPAQPDPRLQLEQQKFAAGREDSGQRLALDRERLDLERQKLAAERNKPAGSFRTLTPEEIRAAGLPAGTSAQVGPDNKIDVLSKRDNTGVLSQKDATTVKNKLTVLKVARKQLEDIKKAFTEGTEGVNAFGPVQGNLPTQQGKKFDAAVGRMRSTLTSLTRVPGVGAMSDYETKLDQEKFPKRTAYESVTADNIQGVDDLLTILERGYGDLLSGSTQQPEAAPAAAPQQAAAPRRVKVDAQGNVLGN